MPDNCRSGKIWVLELFSVGKGWKAGSGKPGVIWAAQRVPDDHVAIIPNWSIIKEIDLSKPDYFKASANYMQVAIDSGWYAPESGQPFIWQDILCPHSAGMGYQSLLAFRNNICSFNSTDEKPENSKSLRQFEPIHTVRRASECISLLL